MHICSRRAWERALSVGTYEGDTLGSEGFIHCSHPSQVVGVANARFRGQANLVLLVIDPTRLEAELRYELSDGPRPFPHLYGPLNVAAVNAVLDFPPGPEGAFVLPPWKRNLTGA